MVSSKENKQFEYLDHTADIMFHSWGKNIEESFEQVALAMFNYMVELDSVSSKENIDREIEVEGHDMNSLLFAFLDEWLFVFSTEFLVCTEIKILEFDRTNWKIRCKGKGETFQRGVHTSGTEIKAITYSCMEVKEAEDKTEIYAIVDI
eukprot:TRINITY_DN6843_c0_g1_i1.p1 TRINITY_DN6843_c0_g1~~TRINITY_DN6843_c0_g1_i1.p1  ORF type:complete len:149 (-),score=20.44 TRINITY_DN6843_c0_g1_i1:192-638(-)